MHAPISSVHCEVDSVVRLTHCHTCAVRDCCAVCSGTIRANLDPFGNYPDGALLAALDAVQLSAFVAQRGGLDGLLTDDGGNASIGQRQLLCLARAVLRGSKIFIM